MSIQHQRGAENMDSIRYDANGDIIHASLRLRLPNPGSSAARRNGCLCPGGRNHGGAGRRGDGARHGWEVLPGCPMHGRPARWDKPRRPAMRAILALALLLALALALTLGAWWQMGARP